MLQNFTNVMNFASKLSLYKSSKSGTERISIGEMESSPLSIKTNCNRTYEAKKQ